MINIESIYYGDTQNLLGEPKRLSFNHLTKCEYCHGGRFQSEGHMSYTHHLQYKEFMYDSDGDGSLIKMLSF